MTTHAIVQLETAPPQCQWCGDPHVGPHGKCMECTVPCPVCEAPVGFICKIWDDDEGAYVEQPTDYGGDDEIHDERVMDYAAFLDKAGHCQRS